ncbi:FecR domain-containing protein [Candidatus Peregrinibacteria bacterium]|nr:FecR domain-containing protein [Candidatus Peregrinibacteria bacterium]
MFKKLLQKLVVLKKENDQFSDELVQELRQISEQVSLNDVAKDRLKGNLLQAVENGETELPTNFCRLADQIEESTRPVILNGAGKYAMWTSIKENISNTDQLSAWSFVRNWRASLASFLIFVMLLGTLVLLPTDGRILYAAKITFLEEVKGEVYVNREGNVMSVNSNFTLEEGDLIFTRSGSFVTIRYLDDSVTRLGENTSLEIRRLYVRPDNQVETQVELNLVNGQIWAGVYNLVDQDSKFVVETSNAKAMVNSKAAFELKASQDATTIAVFDNVVDVTSKAVGDKKVQPVVSGFKAKVEAHTFLAYDNGVSVEKNTLKQDDWAIMNIELDGKHQERLKEEGQKLISDKVASEESLLSFLGDFKDSTKSLFSNSELEQARSRYISASMGFIKAQQILKDADKIGAANKREATPLLLQFRTTIRELMDDQDRLMKTNENEAKRFYEDLKSDLALQRKGLSLVLPRENLYAAKEMLSEVSSYLATNEIDKKEYLLAKSRSKLYEAQQLIAKNDLKGAEAVMEAYWKGIDKLISNEQADLTEDGKNALRDLITEQIDQYKVLTALQSDLDAKGDQKFSGLVNKLKKESLDRLTVLVKTFENQGLPESMLNEIQSMVESYQEQSIQKNDILTEISQIEATKDLDALDQGVIVDIESSPELESTK